jgi:DNA modification methylase
MSKCRVSLTNIYTDNWDISIPKKEVFKLLIKNKCLIFGGNFFTEFLPQGNHWLVWDKKNAMPTYSDCELVWSNLKQNSVKKYEYLWSGMLQQDMKNKEEHYHPTQKPAGLIKKILIDYSEENNLILDCFSGSGTTAVACEDLKRRWICIEKEEKYCEITAQRIYNLDRSLF